LAAVHSPVSEEAAVVPPEFPTAEFDPSTEAAGSIAGTDELARELTPVPGSPDGLPLPRRRTGPARICAVLSGKAGTGKSVIAANLAALVARDYGLTTAVIDLSLQFGDQALMFDAQPTPSLVDVLANIDALTPEFILDCMQDCSGVRVLASPPSPELADLVQAEHLRSILEQLRPVFDFIVLDLSSHLGDIALEAIEESDSLVVITSASLASVKDTKLLLKVLRDLGIPARSLAMVLNRVEPALKMSLEGLEVNIKFPINIEVPHTPVPLHNSVTDGVPVVLSQPRLDFSVAITGIAAAVIEPEVVGAAEKPVRRSFLGLGPPGRR